MLLSGRPMVIDRFRFWLSLGWLRPRSAILRFTKILWLGEVFVCVVGALVGKRLKCRLLDVYADLWRRRALLMAAGVSSPARFGPYSTRAFIASVR